eukprot:g3552.t1
MVPQSRTAGGRERASTPFHPVFRVSFLLAALATAAGARSALQPLSSKLQGHHRGRRGKAAAAWAPGLVRARQQPRWGRSGATRVTQTLSDATSRHRDKPHRATPSLRLAAAAVSDRRRKGRGELGIGCARNNQHRRITRGIASGELLRGGSPDRGGSRSGVGHLRATTTAPGPTGGAGGVPPGGSSEGRSSAYEEAAPALALEAAAAIAGSATSTGVTAVATAAVVGGAAFEEDESRDEQAQEAGLFSNDTLLPAADHPQLVSDILDIVGNSVTVTPIELPEAGVADAAAAAAAADNQVPGGLATLDSPEVVEVEVDIVPDESEPMNGEKNSRAMVTELVAFTLPLLIVWLSNPIMSLVDTAVVGAQSSIELAALGPATSLCDNLAYICGFLAQVTTNLAASALASGDSLKADRATRTGMFVAVGSGVGVSYALLKHGRMLLQLFLGGNPAVSSVLPHACAYAYIRALGFVAVTVSMVLQSYYLARKDIATPIKSVAGASVANLVLDCIAVFGFGMGITGAALSTTVAQWVGLVYLVKEFWPDLQKSGQVSFLPYRKEMKTFLQLGAPTCLALSGQVATCIAVTVAVGGCDTIALAAHQVVYGVFLLFCPIGEAVSQTVQTFLPSYTIKRAPNKDGTPRKTLTFGKSAVRMIKVISAVSVGLGMIDAVLAWLLTAGLPSLFTPDRAVWAVMRSVAPLCGFSLGLHGITMALQGVLMATREVYPTAAIYAACSVFFSGCFLWMRRSPTLHLASVWSTFVVYNVTRCVMFAATVGWSHRAALKASVFPEEKIGENEKVADAGVKAAASAVVAVGSEALLFSESPSSPPSSVSSVEGLARRLGSFRRRVLSSLFRRRKQG